jgi:hypothetical protein
VLGRSTRSLGVTVTIRENIKRRINRALVVMFGGWLIGLVFVLLFVPKGASPVLLIVGVAGFIIYFAATLYRHMGIGCPKCGGNLGKLGNFSPKSKRPVMYCPFCGVSIDQDLAQQTNDA